MPRRVSLPGASELFRATGEQPAPTGPSVVPGPSTGPGHDATGPDATGPDATGPGARGSARVKHDEKITVYVSSDELLALEQARLTLRRSGVAVDRGRIVREAIAVLLADLEQRGESSELVRRLAER